MDFAEDDEICALLPPLEKIHSIDDVSSIATVSEPNWYSTFLSTQHPEINSKKLHDLVVDYLICEGYREAAELLCAEADIIKFPKEDVENLDRRNSIRNSIVNGDISLAIGQINEIVPDLLNNNVKLNFQLVRQQLVEIIRNKYVNPETVQTKLSKIVLPFWSDKLQARKITTGGVIEGEIEKALQFAQDNLTDMSKMSQELLAKLEQTYGLLAFENPEASPFGHLMDLNQRHMLATEVNSSILAVFNKNPTSKLENLFRLMVWSQNQLNNRGDISKFANLEATKLICTELFSEQMDLHLFNKMDRRD